ncbi:hypothetical protein, partial [Limnohabitans radicicola]|uniref:hypothetical protein n=1 Tax=Limnohabitans radicicola TaxID=2771427 RepID=UPI0017809021
ATHLQLVTDGNGAVTDAKLSNSLAPGVALAKSAMDAYVGANSGEETTAAAVVLTGYMTANTLAQQDLNGHFYAANPVFPV